MTTGAGPAAVLSDRLDEVRRRIAATGRSPDEITMVAVSKGFGPEVVAAAAGLGHFGENYSRELLAKAGPPATTAGPPAPPALRWHFLGPVQRNKVARLAPHVWLWQGVDRLAAGAEIARRSPGAAVLVQVNLSGSARRPGCSFEEAPALVEALRRLALDVRGLMGVAGPGRPAAQFRRLARTAGALGLAELSMGMSDDLEAALEEGSTMVRLGRALFGARPGAAQVRP